MRILLACEFYFPSIGGVQEVMRQLAERFASKGHEVTVATTRLADRQTSNINGVHIEEFSVSGNWVNGMSGEVDLYRAYVSRQDYDILMIKAAQQWTFDALIPLLSSITKPKIFIPCGFSGLFDPSYASYFEAMPGWLREFDRLIFYASDYRDINVARKHGLRNISQVPNGADEREFNVERDRTFRSRHNIPQDAFVVMSVGSLTGLKGHMEVAQAFAACDFEGRAAFLLLIGNTPRVRIPETDRFAQSTVGRFCKRAAAMYRVGGPVRIAKWMGRGLLEKLGLGPVLEMLGYRALEEQAGLAETIRRINEIPGRGAVLVDWARPEVIQAYLHSNLFVFASRIEYSPLVLFEAAAAGLPFLSVSVGNAAEIAQWTEGGIICDTPADSHGYAQVDPQVLAKKMEALYAQPELRARLGAAGRRNWQDRFSWSTIFGKYERILEECRIQKGPA